MKNPSSYRFELRPKAPNRPICKRVRQKNLILMIEIMLLSLCFRYDCAFEGMRRWIHEYFPKWYERYEKRDSWDQCFLKPKQILKWMKRKSLN